MHFATDAQRDCYERVLPWLEEIFGEHLVVSEEGPEFGVMVGSAFAQTAIHPFEENEALVCTRAYVVKGVELSYALYDYLLRENHEVLFGGFGVNPSGDVFFQHAILGSTCDKPELEASVMAVASLADRYDDEIMLRWGGERAIDEARRHR